MDQAPQAGRRQGRRAADAPNGAAQDERPWWRHGMVWMVIGGPAVVVVAGIVTAVIAARGADPVLDTRTATPAVEARNHAATPQGPR